MDEKKITLNSSVPCFGGVLIPLHTRINPLKPVTCDDTDKIVRAFTGVINEYAKDHRLTICGCEDGSISVGVAGRMYSISDNTESAELALDNKYVDTTETVETSLYRDIVDALKDRVDVNRKEGVE